MENSTVSFTNDENATLKIRSLDHNGVLILGIDDQFSEFKLNVDDETARQLWLNYPTPNREGNYDIIIGDIPVTVNLDMFDAIHNGLNDFFAETDINYFLK